MKLRRLITKRACVRLTLLLVAGALISLAIPVVTAAFNGDRRMTGERRVTTETLESCTWRCETTSSVFWSRITVEQIDVTIESHLLTSPIPGMRAIRENSMPWWLHSMCRKYSQNTTYTTFGWPARTGYYKSRAKEIDPSQPYWGLRRAVLTDAWEVGEGIIIPTKVIWSGIAINTVFYAAILWGLFAAPFALRRRLRVQRGLCVKCAYDLRGRAPVSEVCPECGWRTAGGAGGARGGTPTP